MKHIVVLSLVIIVILAGIYSQRYVAEAPVLQENGGSQIATSSPTPGVGEEEEVSPQPSAPGTLDEPVACTMDAKLCPDGSYVGRVGPNCEFAACPNDPPSSSVTCTDAMKNADVCPAIYAPVCGLVQVQCITTPCNPIPETFSNGCSACARGNVISYTEGACTAE